MKTRVIGNMEIIDNKPFGVEVTGPQVLLRVLSDVMCRARRLLTRVDKSSTLNLIGTTA